MIFIYPSKSRKYFFHVKYTLLVPGGREIRDKNSRPKALNSVTSILVIDYPKPKLCLDSSLIKHSSLIFFVLLYPHKFVVSLSKKCKVACFGQYFISHIPKTSTYTKLNLNFFLVNNRKSWFCSRFFLSQQLSIYTFSNWSQEYGSFTLSSPRSTKILCSSNSILFGEWILCAPSYTNYHKTDT